MATHTCASCSGLPYDMSTIALMLNHRSYFHLNEKYIGKMTIGEIIALTAIKNDIQLELKLWLMATKNIYRRYSKSVFMFYYCIEPVIYSNYRFLYRAYSG